MRISHVVRGERPVTAELALRLGRAFGQSAQYWINLQNAYDLKIAEREIGSSLSKVRPLARLKAEVPPPFWRVRRVAFSTTTCTTSASKPNTSTTQTRRSPSCTAR